MRPTQKSHYLMEGKFALFEEELSFHPADDNIKPKLTGN